MTAAPDYLGTLRGALSDWLYDPRYTAAPYEAQAAHADAIEAALAECKREGLGDVADNLSRGHGWENTAACWVWRLPDWENETSMVGEDLRIDPFMGVVFDTLGRRIWNYEDRFRIDWWSALLMDGKAGKWTIKKQDERYFDGDFLSLKSPEGLALLDTAHPKVTP